MVNKLFDQYSANIFVNSTLNLVDDAMHFLREDNEALIPARKTLDSRSFAQEFRTISVGCRRQMGHTHLINQLAYNINSPIGRKYSTIIVTPRTVMADHMYGIHAATYEPIEDYKAMQKYASEYNNTMRTIPHRVRFSRGKIVTGDQISNGGFESHRFIQFNKQVISTLTDIDVEDRIDLVCVDCTHMFSESQIHCIYDHFKDHVELFLFLQ